MEELRRSLPCVHVDLVRPSSILVDPNEQRPPLPGAGFAHPNVSNDGVNCDPILTPTALRNLAATVARTRFEAKHEFGQVFASIGSGAAFPAGCH